MLRRATLGRVIQIAHRELRNDSAEVLRRVGEGEIITVTNNGVPAALIVPPGDYLEALAVSGQLRRARRAVSELRSIRRGRSDLTSAEIVADVRGRW